MLDRLIIALVNFICPGLAHLYFGKYRAFLFFSSLPFLSIFFIAWSGLVFRGPALLNFLIALVGIHCVAALAIAKCDSKDFRSSPNRFFWILLCGLTAFLWYAALIHIFLKKGSYLGFDIFQVTSVSMEPTLKHQEFVLADTRYSCFQHGDIVFFNRSVDRQVFVKRIVAVGGEELNLTQSKNIDFAQSTENILRVSKNHFYVMGDNLKSSYDSRDFGEIPVSAMKAKAMLVYRNGRWRKIL